MPKVTVDAESVSHVTYRSRIKVQFSNHDGSISRITWGNPDVMKGLRKMFGVREEEHIASVDITEEGLSANIVRGRRTPHGRGSF